MKVSVCIPCYNAEAFLKETLDSVLAQSHADWQLVCVDDASTDHTWEILQHYASRDPRIKTHRLEKNSGSAAYPLACAVEKSDTDYVVILGNDDVLEPDFLRKAVTRQKETGADIVLCCFYGYDRTFEAEAMWRIPAEDFDLAQELTGRQAVGYTIGKWLISTNGALIKKACYVSPRELDATGLAGQMNADELTSRMALMKSRRVVFCQAAYGYRVHPASVSSNAKRSAEQLLTKCDLAHLLERTYGPESDEAKRSRSDAVISLARGWRKYIGTGDPHQLEILMRCQECSPLSFTWTTSATLGKKLYLSLPPRIAALAAWSMHRLHRLLNRKK